MGSRRGTGVFDQPDMMDPRIAAGALTAIPKPRLVDVHIQQTMTRIITRGRKSGLCLDEDTGDWVQTCIDVRGNLYPYDDVTKSFYLWWDDLKPNSRIRSDSYETISKYVGTSKGTLCQWVNGGRNMGNRRLVEYADRFQVSPFWLLGWTNNPEITSLTDESTSEMLRKASIERKWIIQGEMTGAEDIDYRNPYGVVSDLANYQTRNLPMGTFDDMERALLSLDRPSWVM